MNLHTRTASTFAAEYRSPLIHVDRSETSTKSRLELVSVAMAFIDIAMVIGAAFFVTELYTRFDVISDGPAYVGLSFIAAPLACVLMQQLGLYNIQRLVSPLRQFGLLFFGLALAFFLVLAILAVLKLGNVYSLRWMVAWFFSSFALLSLTRALTSEHLRKFWRDGKFSQHVAIFGGGELGRRIFVLLGKERPNLQVIGVFDESVSFSENCQRGPKLEGGLEELLSRVRAQQCDRVIIALPLVDQSRIRYLLERLSLYSVDVQIFAHDLGCSAHCYGPDSVGHAKLLLLQKRTLSKGAALFKSALDFVLGGISIVILLPLFLVIATAIKLDSKGPIFFVQRRQGYNNEIFRVFKFRTMNVLEDGEDIKQATVDDARVTRIGSFLRRSSLDELPQLINLMKGEMSLVGPRPLAVGHSNFYSKLISEFPIRHQVKPGITGWAQVKGFRGETKDPELMRKRVELDLHYMENWSIGLDIEIVLRTVPAILSGKRAY